MRGTAGGRQRHAAAAARGCAGGTQRGMAGGIRRGRRGDESRRDSGCGRRAAVSGVRGGLVPSCLWLRAAPHGAGLEEEEGRPHIACRAGGGEGRPLQSGRSSKHALGLPTWGARCPQSHRRIPPSVSRISGGSRSGVEQRGLRGTSPLPERRWGRPAVLPTASRWGGGVRWGIRRNSSWGRAVLRWHRLPGGGRGKRRSPSLQAFQNTRCNTGGRGGVGRPPTPHSRSGPTVT